MHSPTTVRYSVSSCFILLLTILVLQNSVLGKSVEEKYSVHCPVVKDLIPLPFPHPKDCSSFFLCNNGTALELQCLEDRLFDADQRYCRKKEEVNCKRYPRNPQPAFAVCPAVSGPKDDVVMFPHPVDCTMYYLCDHGIPLPRKCPSGLHYNRELRTCDFKERANCVLVHATKQRHPAKN